MPTLVQICIVVATLAFVAVVVATILALVRLGEAATRLTVAAQVSMSQVERIVLETQDLLASVRSVVVPAQRVAHRFQSLGERAADLSETLFEEIVEPVRSATAVARGVRSGASRLIELFTRRFVPQTHHSKNGDYNDE